MSVFVLCFKIYLALSKFMIKVCGFLDSYVTFLKLGKYVGCSQILVFPNPFVPHSLLSKFDTFINPGKRTCHFMHHFLQSVWVNIILSS